MPACWPATAVAIGVLLWRGLHGIVPPDAVAADRRLEQDSGLSHRPLAALERPPATADPTSLALWRAHVARGLARARQLRLRWPHPGLAALDLRALRYAVLLALVASAGHRRTRRDRRVCWRRSSRAAAAGPAARGRNCRPGSRRPTYTGLAPVFLKPDHPAVSVPAGAHLTSQRHRRHRAAHADRWTTKRSRSPRWIKPASRSSRP